MFRIPDRFEKSPALQRWCVRNASLCLQSDAPEATLATKVEKMLGGLDTDPHFVLERAYTQAVISEVTSACATGFRHVATEVLATAADIRYVLRYPAPGSLRQKGLPRDNEGHIPFRDN